MDGEMLSDILNKAQLPAVAGQAAVLYAFI
jgi:hypothetical protein